MVGLEGPVVLESPVVLENPVAPGDPVALERGPVVGVALVREEAVLVRGPVVVAARDHPHGLLAAPRGIKSVTAPHHHGLALVPAVEDLAAAVETTRAPAAAEAAAAWVAAA